MKIILALLIPTLTLLTAHGEVKNIGEFVPSFCGELKPRKNLKELNPIKKACVGEVITEVEGQRGEEAFSIGYQTGQPTIFKIQRKLRNLPAMATHSSRQLIIEGAGREYMAIVTLPLTNASKGGSLLLQTPDGRAYNAKLEMVFVTQSLEKF